MIKEIMVPRWLIMAWFALIFAAWGVRGLPWHLDDYDQAKQAYTSYEMIQEGHWWRQHTPRQDPATKPPLAGWISAGLWRFTGSWDLAWRLPSFLAATGILVLLWKSGKKIGGDAGGFVATGGFAWNMLSLRMATLVRTDMLLTALIFGSGWIIWRRLEQGRKWTAGDLAWMITLLGAAAMTKGPIYHAFLLPGMIVWAWLVQEYTPRRKPLPLYLLASVISVLPFLLWTWWCIKQDPQFYDRVVVQEFFGRFTTGEKAAHSSQPWYFYLPHLLAKCVPWSLGLMAAVCYKNVRVHIRSNPAALWLACWAAGGLVVMSLVPSKRVDRIMPVVPVFALLLASTVGSLPFGEKTLRKVIVGFCLAGSLIFLTYTGVTVANAYRLRLNGLVDFGKKIQIIATKQSWKIAISEGRDEGMLIYVGQRKFLQTAEIARKLQNKEIDAAVVDEKALATLKKKGLAVETVVSTDDLPNQKYYVLVRLANQPVHEGP